MHIQVKRIIPNERKNIETALRTPAVLIAVGVGPVVVDGPTHTE